MINNIGTTTPTAVQPQLNAQRMNSKDAASEFEALMIAQIVKQMRSSDSEFGMFAGDSSDSYGSIFDMQMSRFITDQGGFGLADSLRGHIEKLTDTSGV
ncbi:MAG: rod-binding protein [Planctomycetaceae bacterium]|nr:rod-binding protein [Planctomycetaceae bacterium]